MFCILLAEQQIAVGGVFGFEADHPEPDGLSRVDVAFVVGDVGNAILIFAEIHLETDSELLEIADAACAVSPLPRLLQCGQQHGGENCDDGDNDQKFDQGEAFSLHNCTPSDNS